MKKADCSSGISNRFIRCNGSRHFAISRTFGCSHSVLPICPEWISLKHLIIYDNFAAVTDASLRDVARRAGVGLGTLYRRFPTREALLDALLRESFNALAARAEELKTAKASDDALVLWMRETIDGKARPDINGTDLFALIAALAWLREQPSHAVRADHLFGVITGAILVNGGRVGGSTSRAKKKR